MEKIISKTYLNDEFGSDKVSDSIISEAKSIKLRDSRFDEVTVFLSHKHEELKELGQIIKLLKSMGVNVYVDWLDEGMPRNTSGITAQKIKDKINKCHKFILVATEGAISSKWCNWELGYGDAKKYPRDIAIIPISENRNSAWSGNEYLQIYPIITSEYEYIKGKFYVEFKNTKITLTEWLRRS